MLVVDSERKRISLTAKKTLLESSLPLITSYNEADAGKVAHGVVFKVTAKSLMIEFYNNIKAIVPLREVRCVLTGFLLIFGFF